MSYFILGILVAAVGYMVFSQIKSFTQTQENDIREKNKILMVGKILTLMYETESSARAALQSNSRTAFDFYSEKNDTLSFALDSLSVLMEKPQQRKLVDSVKSLLYRKVNNILALRSIKTNPLYRTDIKKAIEKLSDLESSLGKVSVEDDVKNLEALKPDERKNLEEFISIINKYSVPDVGEGASKEILDSVVAASKLTLKEIRKKLNAQQNSLTQKENELLANDLILSQQLRSILFDFEQELLVNAYKMNNERDKALKKSIHIITIAAISGVALAIIFSIMVLNDFWKNQRYRRKLEKISNVTASLLKSREQLISTVSHDLRTPLSAIVGHVELLKNANLRTKEAYYVDRIKSASSYVTNLVNDLLEFTKLEAGKINIEYVPFSIRDSIVETAYSIQSIFRSKPITLVIEVDDRLHRELIGDPFRIRQILTNLMSNAYKFTEEGEIKIIATLLEKYSDTYKIGITIADTGIGIKKDKQKMIFKEFTQAGNDMEKKYDGSGLGLTISKKLAQLLKGTLQLESEVNKGSKFILKLPLKVRKENKLQSIEDTLETLDTKLPNLKIVVIDDDPVLLKLSSEALQHAGITIHTFINAAEALEGLQNISYDGIITDIQMPKMNGFRFVELLKSNSKYSYKNQPIIAVTGRKDMAEGVFLKAGFSAVIYKPYAQGALLKTIRRLYDTTTITHGVAKVEENRNTQKDYKYDLSGLRTFLGDDEESVTQILEVFYATTKTDLAALKTHIDTGNLKALNLLAHKMLAMFRQIRAQNVVAILEDLEHLTLQSGLDEKFEHLKTEVTTVFNVLKA